MPATKTFNSDFETVLVHSYFRLESWVFQMNTTTHRHYSHTMHR